MNVWMFNLILWLLCTAKARRFSSLSRMEKYLGESLFFLTASRMVESIFSSFSFYRISYLPNSPEPTLSRMLVSTLDDTSTLSSSSLSTSILMVCFLEEII